MTPSPPSPPPSPRPLDARVSEFFERLPWRPSPDTILRQWTTAEVFRRFFPEPRDER
jgi:hypothetical protein